MSEAIPTKNVCLRTKNILNALLLQLIEKLLATSRRSIQQYTFFLGDRHSALASTSKFVSVELCRCDAFVSPVDQRVIMASASQSGIQCDLVS